MLCARARIFTVAALRCCPVSRLCRLMSANAAQIAAAATMVSIAILSPRLLGQFRQRKGYSHCRRNAVTYGSQSRKTDGGIAIAARRVRAVAARRKA